MGAYQDKLDAIAEAQAMADLQNQQTGYTQTPYAYEAPESFVVEESTIFTPFASPVPPTQPFNPPATGIASFLSNSWHAASEVLLQQTPSIPTPPSYTYEGPLGGGSLFGLFAPTPDSQAYRDFLARQAAKEKYNSGNVGIAPSAKNDESTTNEIANQTEGPGFWERLLNATREGYNKVPEDENTFANSMMDLTSGLIKPSSYALLAVGGVVLLILLIK